LAASADHRGAAPAADEAAKSPAQRLANLAIRELERRGLADAAHRAYLDVELSLLAEDPTAISAFLATKRVLAFAQHGGYRLGPARGAAASSLVLHLFGLWSPDPVLCHLDPGVLIGSARTIWLDVSFANGRPISELCDALTATIRPWRIEAFRLPLLDIIARVHERLAEPIDYRAIPDDAPEVLEPFRRGEIEHIVWFDESRATLAERLFPEQTGGWSDPARVGAWLRTQRIDRFTDVLRLLAVKRPKSPEMIARMEAYASERETMLLFHEDLLAVMARRLGWTVSRCNAVRRRAFAGKLTTEDRADLRRDGDEALALLVEREAPLLFNKAHAYAQGALVKICAVLKSRHPALYAAEIARWEAAHGLAWSDFGFRNERVCLLK
jgi:hypothetical protein